MGAIAAWLRADLRARWGSLVVLGLLVLLATATVTTTVAGARRGGSAVGRLLDETRPATVVALPNQPDFDWDAVRALPEVEAVAEFAVTEYLVDAGRGEPSPLGHFPQASPEWLDSVERPVVIEGRMADPERADEVMVTANFLRFYDLEVGDTVDLLLYSPDQIDEYRGVDPLAPGGPTVEATIVGVARSGWLSDPVGEEQGAVVTTHGFFTTYRSNLVASGTAIPVNALIRLRGGEADIPAFAAGLAEVSGRSDVQLWNMADLARHARDVAGFEARALLAFGMAAAIASVLLVGQAISRYAGAVVEELWVLRAMGVTSAQARWAAGIGPTLAGLGGALAGVAVAVVASSRFPVGTARDFEPAPGVDVDLALQLPVAVAVPAVVALAAVVAATRAMRATDVAAGRPSTLVGAAAAAGASVAVVTGLRFALEPGRGRTAVPVRPALFGAVAGMAGVVAALTFSQGVNDATGNVERFGVTYDAAAFVGADGEDYVAVDELLATVAADDDVEAVNDARIDIGRIGDEAVSFFTLDPVDTPLPVVLVEGRLPSGPGEMTIAPRSADTAGVAVGDRIEVVGTVGTSEMEVTGIAFVPTGPHNDYASGAWVTPAAYDELFDGFKFRFALVAIDDGGDLEAVAALVAEASGGQAALEPPMLPTEIAELRQVRGLPRLLAAFLAVLAAGAVGHALATAVRRRRRDLAVLRALGLTRMSSRAIVWTQATVQAGVGVVVGVPIGVIVGRALWRSVADSTPVQYLTPTVWLVLVAIALSALVVANLLAVVPSIRAARLRVGAVLRSE